MTGINIQAPYSGWIMFGKKTIETRTYPLPPKYKDKKLLIVETNGPNTNLPARIKGTVIFSCSFKYENEDHFREDQNKHLVVKGARFDWTDEKGKYGWVIKEAGLLGVQPVVNKRKGIIYTTNLEMPNCGEYNFNP